MSQWQVHGEGFIAPQLPPTRDMAIPVALILDSPIQVRARPLPSTLLPLDRHEEPVASSPVPTVSLLLLTIVPTP
jgi:hypothetical protein